jgi:hypothetical protein
MPQKPLIWTNVDPPPPIIALCAIFQNHGLWFWYLNWENNINWGGYRTGLIHPSGKYCQYIEPRFREWDPLFCHRWHYYKQVFYIHWYNYNGFVICKKIKGYKPKISIRTKRNEALMLYSKKMSTCRKDVLTFSLHVNRRSSSDRLLHLFTVYSSFPLIFSNVCPVSASLRAGSLESLLAG